METSAELETADVISKNLCALDKPGSASSYLESFAHMESISNPLN
jgi:hypothetical protein